MQTVNPIKVFVASSVELVDVRMCIGNLIRVMDEEWRGRGFAIQMLCWEDYNPKYRGPKGKQKEYNNDLVERCDIFFALFRNRCGKFTQEEVQVAESLGNKAVRYNMRDSAGVPDADLQTFLSTHKMDFVWNNIDEIRDFVRKRTEDYIANHPERKENLPILGNNVYYGIASDDGLKDMLGNEIRYMSDLTERCNGWRTMLLPYNTLAELPNANEVVALLHGVVPDVEKDELRCVKNHIDVHDLKLKDGGIFAHNLEPDFDKEIRSWNHFVIPFYNNYQILRCHLLLEVETMAHPDVWTLTNDIVIEDERIFKDGTFVARLESLPAYSKAPYFDYLQKKSASSDTFCLFGREILDVMFGILQLKRKGLGHNIEDAYILLQSGDYQNAKVLISQTKEELPSVADCIKNIEIARIVEREATESLLQSIKLSQIHVDVLLANREIELFKQESARLLADMKKACELQVLDPRDYLQWKNDYAIYLQEAGYYLESEELLKELLNELQQYQITDKIWQVLVNLANTYSAEGEIEKAIAIYDQHHNNIPMALDNAAHACLRLNQYERALPYIEKGLRYLPEELNSLEDKLLHLNLLKSKGECYKLQHKGQEAEPFYLQAIKEFEAIDEELIKTDEDVYNNIGYLLYQATGCLYLDESNNYRLAIRYFLKSKTFLDKKKFKSQLEAWEDKSILLHNTAFAQTSLCQYALAFRNYEQAEQMRRDLSAEGSITHRMNLAQTLVNFGAMLMSVRDYAHALPKATEAGDIYKRIKSEKAGASMFDEYIAQADFLRGTILYNQGVSTREDGRRIMEHSKRWAESHPEIPYSVIIISECRRLWNDNKQ